MTQNSTPLYKLPIVAIVGRPNVGKSSLLNVLARRRISIVYPTPGTTRDRVSTIVEHRDIWFELVDTGGLGIDDADRLTEHIEAQIRYAVAEAGLVLFVVDAQAGVQPLDVRVAEMLRRIGRPVILVANKSDNLNMDNLVGEFYSLGFGDPQPTSAAHKRGVEPLLDSVMEHIGYSETPPAEPAMRLAVVGKRNVGKSTFINALAGQDRVIVSEVPGTTRDSIDVRFERDGRTFVAIDTAGIRKKGKFAGDVEFYSFSRAQWSIRRADVALLMIDATMPVSDVDKKLARYIADLYKPVIIVVSKWDLAEQKNRDDPDEYRKYLGKTLPGIEYAPIALTAAKDQRGVWEVVDLALELFRQSQVRVGTAELNKALREAVEARQPAGAGAGKMPKFYYLSQVAVQPPTVVAFVNDPGLLAEDYRRFLLNRLREVLPYGEVPIRLFFRSHHRDSGRSE
jgi:GTP-binding protein